MDNLMVDIEALGTGQDGVITQIGACYFDWEGNISDTFIKNISLASAVELGLKIDAQTVKWWLEQEKPTTWLDNAEPITKVLSEFKQFCKNSKHIWSHSTFDFVMLQNAYRLMGDRKGIGYRSARDIRTLVYLSGVEKVNKEEMKTKKTHNALDDCFYQVEYCTYCYKLLKA